MKKKTFNLLFLVFLFVATILIVRRHYDSETPRYHVLTGYNHTYYKISYEHTQPLDSAIKAAFKAYYHALNPFDSTSVTSMVNRNKDLVVDSVFARAFGIAMQVAEETGGMFDITCAPYINLWGFGFEKPDAVSQSAIDSIRQFTGYEKIRLAGDSIVKDDPRVMVNLAGLGDGYICDMVSDILDRAGVGNYLIDIGGEMKAKGCNEQGKTWRIGINKPVSDSTQVNNEIELVLQIGEGKGIATSGDYRNFHVVDGKKYGHTINPKTGYPACQDILSATVVADRCAVADAYATAFMAMGREQAKKLKEQHPEIEYLFIYADSLGGYAKEFSPGMEKYMVRD